MAVWDVFGSFHKKVDAEIWTFDEPAHLAVLVRCLCCLRSPDFLNFLGDDFRKMFPFSATVSLWIHVLVGAQLYWSLCDDVVGFKGLLRTVHVNHRCAHSNVP